MRSFKFYKDPEGWFVDLPEWMGSKSDLQMVAGADSFLDILSQGSDEVWVCLSQTPIRDSDKLVFVKPGDLESWELGEGAWYIMDTYQGIEYNIQMWLCDVTKFVFGDFPKIIYFK
jgi:hypothetical protein